MKPGKCRIAIIEDNQPDVFLVEHALRLQGLDFDLITLDDGADAIVFLRGAGASPDSPVPDLIVLDLNLPKTDGEQLLQEIRGRTVFSDTPILVWSSSQSPRDLAMVERFGVARYIIKPTGLDEVLKIGGVICDLLKRA
jgi:DNA-binding response OmpR family regulator